MATPASQPASALAPAHFAPTSVLPAASATHPAVTTGAAAAAVAVSDTAAAVTLDNGLVSLTIARKNNPAGRNGEAVSLKYNHDGAWTEMGNGRRAVYFDVGGDRIYPVADADGQVVASTPDFAEVAWVAEPHVVSPTTNLGTSSGGARAGQGGPRLFPFHAELHVVMRRGEPGFYLYAVYKHDKTMPAGSIGESRFVLFGARGRSIFTNHIVDDDRKAGPHEGRGRTLQDVTTLYPDGTVYTKYNNTAYNFDHHVHGMAGHGLGMWMILPANDTIGGGPFKQELTVHADNALLAMLVGGHFGTRGFSVAQGEPWAKIYGPVFVYLNHTDKSGNDGTEALWADAKARAAAEVEAWPYRWLKRDDFPLDLGTVTGRVAASDGRAPAGAWAILSPPDEDWTHGLKGYDYWAQVDAAGKFSIPKVRPGTYRLSFVGGDQFEQFDAPKPVTVAAGDNAAGDLVWPAGTHGQRLWQIGTADRLAFEFVDGKTRQFESFARYLKAFPDDVTYTVGQSTEAKDWYFGQFAVYNQRPYWTIKFDQPRPATGLATLTIGFTAADPHSTGSDNQPGGEARTDLRVKVNGREVSAVHLPKTGTAGYRSASSDANYNVARIAFDAALLKPGANEITLGHANAKPAPADPMSILPPASVMYDAIRLEVDPTATAPTAGPATTVPVTAPAATGPAPQPAER